MEQSSPHPVAVGTPRQAGPENDRWPHRWGFRDTSFVIEPDGAVLLTGNRYPLSGTRMYDFLPFVRECVGIPIDGTDTLREREPKPIGEARRNEGFIKMIGERFGADVYSSSDAERLIHSHGQTTSEDAYPAIYGVVRRPVDLVVWCSSEKDVEDLVLGAARNGVCLVPYGGGTNVSGALVVPEDEQRMVVSVDLCRMNRLLSIDTANLTATFEAGIRGSELESVLASRGYTSGHEPDSIELSTLGGWIATNASGMKKNRYGNIEDMVENVTMVTPEGPIECARSFARTSIGIHPMGIVLGSEGNLGIVTKATLRIHPLPEKQLFQSYLFHSPREGIDFVYRLAHCASVPASVRLMDNLQFRFGQALKGRPKGWKRLVSRAQRFLVTKVLGFDPYRMVVATVVLEGTKEEVGHQRRLLRGIARSSHGFAAGASNGRQGYHLTFAIAYIRDFMATLHILGETFETTAPWDRIEAVTAAVSRRLEELCPAYGIPGRPFLSYRITQLYHTGVCIYFTLGLYLKGIAGPAGVLASIEHELRVAILAAGGSVSHHHGIGKIRREFMGSEISPAAARAIRALKGACDPTNVFGIGNNLFGDHA